MLSHAACFAQGLVYGHFTGAGDEDVYLNCGPLFHLATLMTTVATFVAGGTNVFTPRANAEEICRLIAAERCTGAFLVGPTIKQILDLNADGRYDLSSLRTYPGKPEWNAMVTVDESAWARRPGGYGQTEVTGMLTFTAGGGTGAHGFPSSAAQIRIVDPGDVEVAVGETGEPKRSVGHERLLESARGERAEIPQRLVPHQRSRPARGRRLDHVRGTQDATHQVRARERVPRRGRGVPWLLTKPCARWQ